MVASEISSFFFSPLVPIVSQRFGRKLIIITGALLSAFSLILMSLTSLIENPIFYICAAMGCRLIQGVGDQ
jgi:MFS family permease